MQNRLCHLILLNYPLCILFCCMFNYVKLKRKPTLKGSIFNFCLPNLRNLSGRDIFLILQHYFSFVKRKDMSNQIVNTSCFYTFSMSLPSKLFILILYIIIPTTDQIFAHWFKCFRKWSWEFPFLRCFMFFFSIVLVTGYNVKKSSNIEFSYDVFSIRVFLFADIL